MQVRTDYQQRFRAKNLVFCVRLSALLPNRDGVGRTSGDRIFDRFAMVMVQKDPVSA